MSMIIATFENGELMPSHADDFFRYHDTEATEVESDGDQNAGPLGYFTLRRIERDHIAAYVAFYGDPWASVTSHIVPGWYIDARGYNGAVWAFYYGGHCPEHDDLCTDTHSEERARKDYAEGVRVNTEWFAKVD